MSKRIAIPQRPPQTMPLYTIGIVTQITSIGEATLRVWERRYHFPHTTRSAGGHRLYSERDVIALQWVKLRMDGGMQAGRAIRALRQTSRAAAVAATLHMPLPTSTFPAFDDVSDTDDSLAALAEAQQRLTAALLDYQSEEAERILAEALAHYPIPAVTLRMILPTLAAIGEGWSGGEVAVATEHFATNFLRQHLLLWMHQAPAPYHVNVVALAGAPGELHEGSLLMLGVLLRYLRWPVMYLGQSFPLTDMSALAQNTTPAVMVFVAMSAASAQALAEHPCWDEHTEVVEYTDKLNASDIPETPDSADTSDTDTSIAPVPLPIVGFGGRAFTDNPTLIQQTPGVFLGATLNEGCARIHRLLLDLNALHD